MARGRPPRCIHCGSTHSISKGARRTKTLGIRRIRVCKNCGRKFTPRAQKYLSDSDYFTLRRSDEEEGEPEHRGMDTRTD